MRLLGRRQGYRFLFIVTYGRSGSTLLQGVLNSIPGYLIRGENGHAVYRLWDFHRTAMHERRRRGRAGELPPTHPWWGIDGYPPEVAHTRLRQVVVDTLLRPGRDDRVLGFKEIRWHHHQDLPDYLAFLQEVFPGAGFVLNTRRLQDVAASGWWQEREDALTELRDIERRLTDAVGRLGDAAHHVHYDDYVADPRALASLFDWLGEGFDEDTVRSTMRVKHSYRH